MHGDSGERIEMTIEADELEKKYSEASTVIGAASALPIIENIQGAYGKIVDFVSSIPIPKETKASVDRNDLLGKLDEISIILYGSYKDGRVMILIQKHNLMLAKTRVGMRMLVSLSNLPTLVNELRDILIRAGELKRYALLNT
jgi:hypothetical protein